MHTHTQSLCSCIYMYTPVHIIMYYLYTSLCIANPHHTYICAYIYLIIYMYTSHTYIYIYTYIYIHTYYIIHIYIWQFCCTHQVRERPDSQQLIPSSAHVWFFWQTGGAWKTCWVRTRTPVGRCLSLFQSSWTSRSHFPVVLEKLDTLRTVRPALSSCHASTKTTKQSWQRYAKNPCESFWWISTLSRLPATATFAMWEWSWQLHCAGLDLHR